MMKCLSLPQTGYDEMKFPADLKHKIENGLPLWEERPPHDSEEDEQNE